MAEDDSPELIFAIFDADERRRKVEALSDESLFRLHASLHASKLINETVWVPLLEEEMARRDMLARN